MSKALRAALLLAITSTVVVVIIEAAAFGERGLDLLVYAAIVFPITLLAAWAVTNYQERRRHH